MYSEVSAVRRILQIGFGVFYCLTCSGIIFGYAAIKPILIVEGAYAEVCAEGETFCAARDILLNRMFTVSAVSTSLAGLPSGFLLDKFGPKKCSLLGGCLLTSGALIFGSGKNYVLGYFLMAIAGPLFCLTTFHLSNAFPAYSGIILSALMGSFDASAVCFAVYAKIYNFTAKTPSLKTFFWTFAFIPVSFILEQLIIGAPESYQRVVASALPIEEEITDGESVTDEERTPHALSDSQITISQVQATPFLASGFSQLHALEEEREALNDVTKKELDDQLTGIMYEKTLSEQIKSYWFILLVLYVCVNMTRINYYILSIDGQLEYFTKDHDLALKLTDLFNVMLPIGGLVAIPVIGIIIDKRPFIDVITLSFSSAFIFGLSEMFKSTFVQAIGIFVFVFYRPLMYISVSESMGRIFGFKSFGTLYGLSMTIAGVIALLNAPLDIIVHTKMNENYAPVDIIFLILGVITSGSLLFAIYRQNKKRIVLED